MSQSVYYRNTHGAELTRKQLNYVKRVAKYMDLPWNSITARPSDSLTLFILECCDAGTPSSEVPALWLLMQESVVEV